MHIKRRQFIKSGSFAAAGTILIPKFLKAFENEKYKSIPAGNNKVVVIIQLSGGNDGLNTVIPINNDIYYRERPHIAIKKEESLKISDEIGLHPSLSFFRELYMEGSLAILNGVGYPNPDRSHFRSMDIWHTASQSNEYLNTGWLGRYLDAQCNGCDHPTQAIELDDTLSLALKGQNNKGVAMKDPRRLYNAAHERFFKDLSTTHISEDPTTDYLYKTLAATLSSADYIFNASKQNLAAGNYPSTELGKSLQTIASLILSDINTKVYYVSLGSFDTHINQEAQQKKLLAELNDAVNSFVSDLKQHNRFNDLLLFTFSEFGRRVAQNASGGTDHGTANNMFMISGAFKMKGICTPFPNLNDLIDGDLKYSIDFKQVYATILNKWLNVNDEAILGKKYDYIDFI